MYSIGDIVEVADEIDPLHQDTIIATVKYIEPDDTFEGLNWIYLVANEEVLNQHTDMRFGLYWKIVSEDYAYMRLIHPATFN